MDRPGLISPHFHFEQHCWQINGYKETHLNWLYYSGCLEYPSSHDGNRLGSQKKMEVQRDFAGLLSICLKPAHEKCRLADSGLAVNSARWLLCPAPSPAQHSCRGTLCWGDRCVCLSLWWWPCWDTATSGPSGDVSLSEETAVSVPLTGTSRFVRKQKRRRAWLRKHLVRDWPPQGS